ncbi:MAG: nucleoside phosphorylase [Hespellia sp.]|nr:nucleoside phosphorylase [Hespellia sp.]
MNETGSKATAPTVSGKVYHLRLGKGEIPPYVLLPGDQGVTYNVLNVWKNVKELAYNREYRTVLGDYKGVSIAMTSTGIGDQPAEICLNELKKVGAHTCIKIGTVEAIREDLELGDIIIPVACMRKGGAVTHYVKAEFPAVPDIHMTKALIEACENLGYQYTLGVIGTISSYYIGQGRPIDDDPSSYYPPQSENLIERMRNAKVLGIDTETAGELIIGYLNKIRMGAILSVHANRMTGEWGDNGGEEKTCRIASEAIRILKEQDEQQKK